MKKILTISSALLWVIFLAGCGQKPVSQTQPRTPAPVAEQPEAGCQNFPGPSFCPSGIDDVIVTGIDANGCSTYDCKSNNADQSVPTTPVNTQNYIEVKEFGIKIPVDSAVAGDLEYTFKKAGVDVSVDVATFSSKSLTATDKNCGSGSGPIIQKILGTPSKPGIGADSAYYTSRISDIKQFSGYFLVFFNSQDYCSSGKYFDLEKKLDQAVSAGFKNSIPLTQ